MNVATIGDLPFLLGQTSVPSSTETLIKWACGWPSASSAYFPGSSRTWSGPSGKSPPVPGPDRPEPRRALGLLQPIADAIKLLTKESIVPKAADQWVHLLAPVLILVSAIPGAGRDSLRRRHGPGEPALGHGLSRGGLEPLAARDLPGRLVEPKQIFPLGRDAFGRAACLVRDSAGALDDPRRPLGGKPEPRDDLRRQQEIGWFVLSPPGLLAFVILVDFQHRRGQPYALRLPEAESEIIAGYHTEYSGMRFGLFFLAEYMSVFGVSCLGTVLFLGRRLVCRSRRSANFP